MPFPPRGPSPSTKPIPAEGTSAEAVHLKSLGEKPTPVSIKLTDGQVVEGWIEYYDKDMLRLTREHSPNLFIFKHDIVYISHLE
jgi:host factor-I protein